MELRYFIADTETVGMKAPPGSSGVCDVAIMEVDEQLNMLGFGGSLINPECTIDPHATAVHGITNEMVADAPTLKDWLEGLDKDPSYLICHNLPFDRRFLSPYMNLKGGLCTLQLARKYVKDSPNHKLGTLAAHFGVPQGTAHRAMGDVETLYGVLAKLLELAQVDLKTLIERASEVSLMHVMPFGKHAGTPILKLPRKYIEYMLTLDDLTPDLRMSLQHALKSKI